MLRADTRTTRRACLAATLLLGVVACGSEAADVAADAAQDVAADASSDAAADVAADAALDVAADAAVDAATDVAPDVATDVAADATTDVAADVAADVAVDVAADVAADVAVDVAADVAVDVAADVAVDVATDVPVDVCDVVATSDLPGVSLSFVGERCVWTRAELAEGVTIDWQLDVNQPLGSVHPASQDAGGCGRPEDSGLITFFSIGDDTSRYCLCDVGLCFREDLTVDLVPGTWTGSSTWHGREWYGPSDTGNPEGEPFEPGTYDATVSAIGTYTVGTDGPEFPFEVRATMPITVLP